MELIIAKDLDKILDQLIIVNMNIHWFELLGNLKIEKTNSDLLFKELNTRKFIDVIEIAKGDKLIKINSVGKAFRQSSSFVRERKNSKTKHIWTTTKQTIMIIGSIISTIGTGLTIYLGILNYNKDITIKDLNTEIKTLKQENKQLQDNLTSTTFKTTDNKTKK